MAPNLIGKVCLVTGASRGIGRGIALQLGQAGATVYVTGRHQPTLEACIQEIKERGAKEAIPLQGNKNSYLFLIEDNNRNFSNFDQETNEFPYNQAFFSLVDHSNDKEVEQIFTKIAKDQNGQLDLLVNNAYAGVDIINQQMKKPFWRACPYETWDTINGVGLRNHFACTSFASRYIIMCKND